MEIIDFLFTGCLDKPNGHLPEGLKPKKAIGMVETQVNNLAISQQLVNNLIHHVLDRTYSPSQNGPRDYFIECDNDTPEGQDQGHQ